MLILKSVNLAWRFFLELCALAALAYWGFHLDQGIVWKVIAGLGAPLATAVLWGTFVSPKAPLLLSEPWRFGLELVIFGLASAGLAAAERPLLAWLLMGVFIVNRLLLTMWRL